MTWTVYNCRMKMVSVCVTCISEIEFACLYRYVVMLQWSLQCKVK